MNDQRRRGRWTDEQSEHQQRTDGLEAGDDAQREEAEQDCLGERRSHPQGLGLHPIEGEGQERPVEHQRDHRDEQRCDQLGPDVCPGHAEHVTEQQRRDLGRERPCAERRPDH